MKSSSGLVGMVKSGRGDSWMAGIWDRGFLLMLGTSCKPTGVEGFSILGAGGDEIDIGGEAGVAEGPSRMGPDVAPVVLCARSNCLPWTW